MLILNIVSVILEIAIVFIGLAVYLNKNKRYGLCISFTFAVYAFYDLSRFFSWDINKGLLSVIFFLASLSVFWAMLKIYRY
ncbi:MAG: hypothetical protein C4533_04890 [Candidatus Omnitrophota bacterium]|jgi:hypothetical protein|nr:MAG: hypothetical protein C4533_04890 [Candidatus Omnitrophota bacterium]